MPGLILAVLMLLLFAQLSAALAQPGPAELLRGLLGSSAPPRVALDWSCDERRAIVSLRPEAEPTWPLPLCLAYGEEVEQGRACTLLRQAEVELRLVGERCPAWVLPSSDPRLGLAVDLSDEGWSELIDHLDRLPAEEATAVLRDLARAFRAGRVPAGKLLDAAAVAVRSPHTEVALPPRVLIELVEQVLPEALRADARLQLQDLYRPLLDRVSPEEAPMTADAGDDAPLRDAVLAFYALDLRAPDVRGRLQALAQPALGGESDPLPPDLLATALAVALEEEGAAFAAPLIERHLDEPDLRAAVLAGFARQGDPAVAERVWSLVLVGGLSPEEATALLEGQRSRPALAEPLFAWSAENYDALLERLPPAERARLPLLAAGLCTIEDRDRVAAFHAPRTPDLPGGARALAETLAAIEACAALVAAQREDAAAAFEVAP